jgi:hypothetical protein
LAVLGSEKCLFSAVVQLPKIVVTGWLRTHLVMKAIKLLGFSRGSFSPDYMLARPYALAIAYMIPTLVIGFMGLRRARFPFDRRGLLTLLFFIAAAVDYVLTLTFYDEGLLMSQLP